MIAFIKPEKILDQYPISQKLLIIKPHTPIQTKLKFRFKWSLELRQYKNGLVSMKRMLVLKLPPIFPCRVGERKMAAISKQTFISKKQVRSYIVLALRYFNDRSINILTMRLN